MILFYYSYINSHAMWVYGGPIIILDDIIHKEIDKSMMGVSNNS